MTDEPSTQLTYAWRRWNSWKRGASAASPGQPASRAMETQAGKTEENKKGPLRETEQQSGTVHGERERESGDKTVSAVEQRGTARVVPRGRSRRGERRKPAHRVHRGFDIRSRQDRGRSRERKERGTLRGQTTRHIQARRDLQILTWNVGGMPMERLEEAEIVALQEVSCPEGITEMTHGRGEDRWHIVVGRRKEEWSGRMIAVKATLGKIVQKEIGTHALGVCVRTGDDKVGILNVHLPPKATVPETGAYVALWERMHALRQTRKILAGDLNET